MKQNYFITLHTGNLLHSVYIPIKPLSPIGAVLPPFENHNWWKDERMNLVSSDLLCNARDSPPGILANNTNVESWQSTITLLFNPPSHIS